MEKGDVMHKYLDDIERKILDAKGKIEAIPMVEVREAVAKLNDALQMVTVMREKMEQSPPDSRPIVRFYGNGIRGTMDNHKFNIDDNDLKFFGVMNVGSFNPLGGCQDWHVRLDEGRWLDLPIVSNVLFLNWAPGYEVYIHGYYSERMTKKRREIMGIGV